MSCIAISFYQLLLKICEPSCIRELHNKQLLLTAVIECYKSCSSWVKRLANRYIAVVFQSHTIKASHSAAKYRNYWKKHMSLSHCLYRQTINCVLLFGGEMLSQGAEWENFVRMFRHIFSFWIWTYKVSAFHSRWKFENFHFNALRCDVSGK